MDWSATLRSRSLTLVDVRECLMSVFRPTRACGNALGLMADTWEQMKAREIGDRFIYSAPTKTSGRSFVRSFLFDQKMLMGSHGGYCMLSNERSLMISAVRLDI